MGLPLDNKSQAKVTVLNRSVTRLAGPGTVVISAFVRRARNPRHEQSAIAQESSLGADANLIVESRCVWSANNLSPNFVLGRGPDRQMCVAVSVPTLTVGGHQFKIVDAIVIEIEKDRATRTELRSVCV